MAAFRVLKRVLKLELKNNIPKVFPPTNTVGKQIPLHKFSDLIRSELAQAGYIESLTMSLLSIKENYEYLRRPFNEDEAV
jgi:phenylalanyl-tRNA synthetase beta chain